jgi:hypothetical protein
MYAMLFSQSAEAQLLWHHDFGSPVSSVLLVVPPPADASAVRSLG